MICLARSHVLSCVLKLKYTSSRVRTPVDTPWRDELTHQLAGQASSVPQHPTPDNNTPVNMSRPIEQALLSLLPTQNANLPPALVELAGSLLAQSRNKASTLKAEEEVARTYACAHLACDR